MGTESPANPRSIASADEKRSLSAAKIEETRSAPKVDDWLPITSSRNAKWWYSAFHNVTDMIGSGVLSLPSAMSKPGRSEKFTMEILLSMSVGTGMLSIAWAIDTMQAAISWTSKHRRRALGYFFILGFLFVHTSLLHSGFVGLDKASCTASTISARYTLACVRLNVQYFPLWKMREDGKNQALVGPLGPLPWAQAAQPLDTCFMDLPGDVHLKILNYLPAVDIAKMACMSKELRYLSSDNLLWMNKFEAEIAENSTGNCSLALKLPLRFKIASYLTPSVNITRMPCLCSEFKHFSSNNSSWKPKIGEDLEAASKGKIENCFKKFYVLHKTRGLLGNA